MGIEVSQTHICIEKKMMSDCPVCHEYLFDSVVPVSILPLCGHCMHVTCMREYQKTHHTCPICNKCMDDMSDAWAQMDFMLEIQPMPEEYADSRAEILCNDCNDKCNVSFHFISHKCTHCGSHNTRILSTTGMPAHEPSPMDTGADEGRSTESHSLETDVEYSEETDDR
jgi:5-methylcytosine-specific restriction endonuclease McrA